MDEAHGTDKLDSLCSVGVPTACECIVIVSSVILRINSVERARERSTTIHTIICMQCNFVFWQSPEIYTCHLSLLKCCNGWLGASFSIVTYKFVRIYIPTYLLFFNFYFLQISNSPEMEYTIGGIFSLFSGFTITPLTPDLGCELGYVTHTNPKGNLPTWVSNKLSSTFAPKLVRRLHKACLKYDAWKASHEKGRKPWMFPEQIESPRINVNDVSS